MDNTPALYEKDTRWETRLLEICQLKDGWLDGEEGLPLSAESSDSAWEICKRVEKDGYPRPGIFPTPEGGIQLEWALGKDRECREIINFSLEPDLSYDLHRVTIANRGYEELRTPLMDIAFMKLAEWFAPVDGEEKTLAR
jgi:hypothetical protein